MRATSKMQIARLEAELKNLKEGGGVNADNMMLQQLLDDATLAKNKLEQDFLVAHTDKLVLEAQLTAIRGGTSVEGYVRSKFNARFMLVFALERILAQR
jgi:protein HOOK3